MRFQFTLVLISGLAAVGCAKPSVDVKAPVRGLSLHVVCRGEGSPPVILEAGMGNDSSVWSSVLPEVARTTQVCAYDRAGLGASSPAPRPHSNRQMADELHDLLRAVHVPEPFILVGHSMGGANVRYLAAKSPQAVAGMVLVDSVSHEQPKKFWSLLPDETLLEFKQLLTALPEGLDFDTLSAGYEGLATVNPSLGATPLVVLAHTKPVQMPPSIGPQLASEMEGVWRSMQEQLPRLSSNSAFLAVPNAGHHIQLDRPDVVVAAINEMVGAVREKRRLNQQAIIAAK
jgi:pimeloyl-ACP methyl ester carboxylesterase